MRTTEQGSVVGYVLGIILLLAVLLGGIALYKNYATNSGSNNQVTNEQQANDDKAAQNEAALKKQQEEAEKKATDSQGSSSTSTGSSVAQVPTTSTAPTSNLPATGPSDIFVTMIGAAMLTGAAVAYVRSRVNL